MFYALRRKTRPVRPQPPRVPRYIAVGLAGAFAIVPAYAWLRSEGSAPASAAAAEAADPAIRKNEKPRIEICFVLDTTGSMAGLIEGAKQKIWSITNEIISTKPTPQIKLGLIGYRDRGDHYVTKGYSLTDDIDAIYGKLMTFQASGGGDTAESVNEALHEAVTKMEWSKDRDVLKIIFLVGDAPPHMDYKDDVKYQETCRLAARSDLIINTIQCGTMTSTEAIWREIAQMAEGSYVSIGQTGDTRQVTTPHDEQLSTLQRQLGKTVYTWGTKAEQAATSAKVKASAAAPAEATAARSSVLAKSGGKAVTGKGDLLADLAGGVCKLEDIKEAELPEELKKLTPQERKAFIEKEAKKRKELNEKLIDLVKQRDAHIAAGASNAGAYGDSFDRKVSEIVQDQAQRKGIQYGK